MRLDVLLVGAFVLNALLGHVCAMPVAGTHPPIHYDHFAGCPASEGRDPDCAGPCLGRADSGAPAGRAVGADRSLVPTATVAVFLPRAVTRVPSVRAHMGPPRLPTATVVLRL